jgi:hypothetical protein
MIYMALVACRECGSKISDSAATCPQCGVSAPAGAASLTFIRSGFINSGIKIAVFVDQQPFGIIKGKTTVSVPVTPGLHHIELRTADRKPRSTVGTVQVSHGDTVITVTMSGRGQPAFQ